MASTTALSLVQVMSLVGGGVPTDVFRRSYGFVYAWAIDVIELLPPSAGLTRIES